MTYLDFAEAIHKLGRRVLELSPDLQGGRPRRLRTPAEIAERMALDEAYRYRMYAVAYDFHAAVIEAGRAT